MLQPRMPYDHCPICLGKELVTNITLPWAKIHGAYQMLLGEETAAWVPQEGYMHIMRCKGCDLFFCAGAEEAAPGYYQSLSESNFLDFDYYPATRPGFAVAARSVRVGDSVLDVGCGAAWFAEAVPNASYTGLEFNEAGLRAARSRGVSIHAETVAEHALRVGSVYDVVCAFEVLEHVADPLAFLRGCIGAIRPGGRLVLSVPSAQSFYPFVVNELLNLPPHHLTRWTDAALRNLGPFIGADLVELEMPSILQSGHGRFYFAHLFENAEIDRCGIDAEGGVCIDPRFPDIRRRANASADALLKAVRNEMQLPRGVTVCATFTKPEP